MFLLKVRKYCVNCRLHSVLCLTNFACSFTEMFVKFGKIPTVTEILNILVMDPKDIETDETKKAILNWYFDRWLPVAGGSFFWGSNIRYYHYPVDKEAVVPGESSKKVWVTVASEAFGLLMLENCHVSYSLNIGQITQNFGTYFF